MSSHLRQRRERRPPAGGVAEGGLVEGACGLVVRMGRSSRLVEDASHPSLQPAQPRQEPALVLSKVLNSDHSCLPCWYFPFLYLSASKSLAGTVRSPAARTIMRIGP